MYMGVSPDGVMDLVEGTAISENRRAIATIKAFRGRLPEMSGADRFGSSFLLPGDCGVRSI